MTAQTSHIHWISEIDDSFDHRLNKRIAGIAALKNAGLNVPPGFLVSHTALNSWLQDPRIADKLNLLLKHINLLDDQQISRASSQASKLLNETSLPLDIAQQIVKAHNKLKQNRHLRVSVFVDSLLDTSRKFDHHSLWVSGDANLLQAVKQLWITHAFSKTSVFNLAKNQQSFSHFPISIVIQAVDVPAVSGTLLTTGPNLDSKNQLVIEAVWGLPQTLLDGAIAPDQYRFDRTEATLLHSQTSKQTSMITYAQGRIKTQPVAKSKHTKPKLNENQLQSLVKIGQKLHKFHFFPQEIIWLFSQNKFQIVSLTQVAPFDVTYPNDPKTPLPSVQTILTGIPYHQGIVSAPARVVTSQNLHFNPGTKAILVTKTFDKPLLKHLPNISAIVAEADTLTSDSILLARELGIPTILAAKDATKLIRSGQIITVNGSTGQISIGGISASSNSSSPKTKKIPIQDIPTATKIFLSGPSSTNTSLSGKTSAHGLFFDNNLVIKKINIHPGHLLRFNKQHLLANEFKTQLQQASKSFGTSPLFVQLSDLTSRQLLALENSTHHQKPEANPLLGHRGTTRHISLPNLLKLELVPLSKLKKQKASNLNLVLPFTKYSHQLQELKKLLATNHLHRSVLLKHWLTVSTPANILEIDKYVQLGLDGLVLNFDYLYTFTYAQQNTSVSQVHPNDAITKLLGDFFSITHQHKLPVIIIKSNLHKYYSLIERFVHMGCYGIVVKPEFFSFTSTQVAQAEHHKINHS